LQSSITRQSIITSKRRWHAAIGEPALYHLATMPGKQWNKARACARKNPTTGSKDFEEPKSGTFVQRPDVLALPGEIGLSADLLL